MRENIVTGSIIMFGFLQNISSTEITLIILLLVIIFGGKSVMDAAKKGGEAFKEIKKIEKNIMDSLQEGEDSDNNQS